MYVLNVYKLYEQADACGVIVGTAGTGNKEKLKKAGSRIMWFTVPGDDAVGLERGQPGDVVIPPAP